MKVLQTPVRFYPYLGGVENYTHNLSKELVRLGRRVTVICANEPESSDREVDGIKVKRLDYIGKIANTNVTLSLPLKLLKEDFDIIHTHLPTPWSADWSVFISRLKGKPVVLTYHNDIVGRGFSGFLANIYNISLLKLLLRFSTKIIVTQPKYVEYSPYLKCCKKKIVFIPPGVDTNLFRPNRTQPKKNRVFFLSVLDEFHKYKGLDCLLDALVEVKSEIPEVQLVIGGGGGLVEYYKKMTSQRGLEKNVIFLGGLSWEELLTQYNECTVFVLPSVSSKQEGFGMVSLEAMACAKPVVVTDIIGAAEDIKEREAGLVVEPKNSKDLAGGIRILLQDQKLASKMGANGRKLVEEKYDWGVISHKIEKLYEQLK